jgi:hypothetical protein
MFPAQRFAQRLLQILISRRIISPGSTAWTFLVNTLTVPVRLVHYLQDTLSHAGFENSTIRQAEVLLSLKSPLAVDYTSADVGKASQMAAATWFAIRDWIRTNKCKCGDQGDTEVNKWFPQVITFLGIEDDQMEPKRLSLDVPGR